MNDFLKTVWNGVKRVCLATFCGFRQCVFQLLCWEIFELIVNLMGFYLYGDHPGAFTVRWSVYLCIVVFTMLYHWLALIIPKEERLARFVIPYIICVVGWLSGMVIIGTIVPFICLLFFFMESYLKKALTSRPKAFKRIKIAYNTVALLPFLLIAVIAIASTWSEISRKHRFDDAKTLTRITEVEFPKLKVVEYDYGGSSFHGDYSDELILEFKELPSEEFYAVIDSHARCDNHDGWYVEGDSTYNYSRMWGNGLPAPPGEDDEEDMSLEIEIKRGEKRFHVSYGAW